MSAFTTPIVANRALAPAWLDGGGPAAAHYVRPFRLPASRAEPSSAAERTFFVVAQAESTKKKWEFSKWGLARGIQSALFFSPLAKFLKPEAAKEPKPARKSVLVAGATGGVGRRVVARLLRRGYEVRALVRDMDVARGLLGPDVQLFQGDLFNVPVEAVKGASAVVSCIGTKVGPAEGDTPDRQKYYQGLKFYQPVVVENTPENVEFKGLANLLREFQEHGAPRLFKRDDVLPVWSFADDEARAQWGPVDDVVMGGASKSEMRFEGDVAVFEGLCTDDNNGGFCSWRTRAREQPLDLSPYEGFFLRVRGDGFRYKFNVRTDTQWDGPSFSAVFDTVPGQWMPVKIPFAALKSVRRNRLSDERFDAASVRSVQIMLSKFEYEGDLNPTFKAGDFRLELESIGAYRSVEAAQFVHCSSAGVTRPGRPGINLEDEPPAVRMNEMLGRIMDWKLAGEDALRASGLRYTIVRPCALTDAAGLGPGALRAETGDTMRGQVSREEIADLMVAALEDPRFVNKTFEVARRVDVVEGRAPCAPAPRSPAPAPATPRADCAGAGRQGEPAGDELDVAACGRLVEGIL
eukprot:tig00001657_g9546.t1